MIGKGREREKAHIRHHCCRRRYRGERREEPRMINDTFAVVGGPTALYETESVCILASVTGTFVRIVFEQKVGKKTTTRKNHRYGVRVHCMRLGQLHFNQSINCICGEM